VTLLSSVGPLEETPIDRYLDAQADLSAVERFAQRHEAEVLPRQARYYRDLIPLGRPRPGEQYAFAVDMDACTGCKACVTACHSLNGLDAGESWRRTTVLADSPQTVTAACHHSVDPACLKGCPVDAYEKDPITGIVAHLDDQCIGCSYCTLTCPYEVPVFNQARGIVRKCDMCQGRLTAGEAPACVQACPNGAITIEIVDVATIASTAAAAGAAIVPAAPPSAITAPSTTYRTRRAHEPPAPPPRPAHAGTPHTPLAVMLVLTQLSVGAFIADLALRAGRSHPFDAAVALAAGVLALGASVLHLGRPRYAYRSVIGLRHSWLSREVLAFGAFTGLAALHAGALVLGRSSPVLAAAVAVTGAAGVGCSVMIYATTHRASWRAPVVASKFGLTTAVAGLATVLWASAVVGTPLPHARPALVALAVAAAVALAVTRPPLGGRVALALAGGVALPVLMAVTSTHVLLLTVMLGLIVASELRERGAFFTEASPPE
jgi:Fe-S-cluster-containing dehydrogenase component/DMSO reductase anchor subunit